MVQKPRKLLFGWLSSVVTMLHVKYYTTGKPVNFTLNAATFVRKTHFWVEQQSWVCGLHSWKPFQIFSLFCYWLLFGAYWIGRSKSEETKYIGNLTMTNQIWQVFHGCSSHTQIYCRDVLLQHRNDRPNANFCTFCLFKVITDQTKSQIRLDMTKQHLYAL